MRLGCLNLLTLTLIVLKLTGFIHWSWWLVTAPSTLAILIFLAAVTLGAWLMAPR